jgi:frataxin-like iron-binding protein CyaY
VAEKEPSSVLITKPNGITTLFDLDEVLMAQYDPEKATLTLEFKNQSTSVLNGGPWVEQLWDIMKKKAGFSANEDRNRSAWSKELSVKYSGKLPEIVPAEPKDNGPQKD